MLVCVSEEAPRYHIDDNNNRINCIARAVRAGKFERSPLQYAKEIETLTDSSLTNTWDNWVYDLYKLRLNYTRVAQ